VSGDGPSAARRAPSSRSVLFLSVLAALAVLVPFLTWHQTWFGRQLTPEQLTDYLADDAHPRRVQHALSQLADRIERGNPSATQWYAGIAEKAGHPSPEVRASAAWTMGQDNGSEMFHGLLRDLLNDPEPMVRQNAALALVRFQDDSGRDVLAEMLRPYPVRSPRAGTVALSLEAGQAIGTGTLLAQISADSGDSVEVRSPHAGHVADVVASNGAHVNSGDRLIEVSPETDQVWEALRALYLVGRAEDLPLVQKFEQGVEDMPDRVREQAELTSQAIRTRSTQSPIR